VLDIFGEGGRVAVRVGFSGTHSATYIDAPASNKTISSEVLERFKFEDGKMAESWGDWPDYGMLQQMK